MHSSILEARKDLIINETHKAAKYCQGILAAFHSPFEKEKLVIRNDFSLRRRRNKGGKYANGYGVNICSHTYLTGLSYFQKLSGDYIALFHEYPSFAGNPIIGSAYITDPIMHLRLVVGHEMAHACQFFLRDTKGWRSEPHGLLFKSIYKSLRVELNKELPDQTKTQIRYQELLKSIKKEELNA